MNKKNKFLYLLIIITLGFILNVHSFELEEENYLVINNENSCIKLLKDIKNGDISPPTHIAITNPEAIRTSDYMDWLGRKCNKWGVTHFRAKNLGLTSEDIRKMENFFRYGDSIQYLDLSGNKISGKCFDDVILSAKILSNPPAKEVDMRRNPIKENWIKNSNSIMYTEGKTTKIYFDGITVPYDVGIFEKYSALSVNMHNWVWGSVEVDPENYEMHKVENMPKCLKNISHSIIAGAEMVNKKTEACFKGLSSLLS